MRGSRPARIAFVHSSLKFGGAERATLNLALALKHRGYEIDVLLMSAEGELLQEARDNFNLVDLDCQRTWKLPGRLLAYLRRRRPLVLVPSFWRLNLCACLARLFVRGPKLALWEHSPPSRIAHTPNWLYFLTASLFYQAATKVIAVSDGVAADIKGITIGLGRKIVTVYNAIPAPPQPSANRLEGPRRRIIWVGRLAHPKNPALMIEAFARLPRGEGYSLDILGDGQQRDDLEKRVLELGLADRVRFLGFQADVYAHLAAAHLLVLSSDREGLGNVLVEALNAGLSIVSTDCGEGVHEILQDGTYGTIVPVNDPRAMAEAIESEAGRERDPGFQRTGGARFDPPYVAERFLSALGLG